MTESNKLIVGMVLLVYLVVVILAGIFTIWILGLNSQVQHQQDLLITLNHHFVDYRQESLTEIATLKGYVYELQEKLDGYEDFCIQHDIWNSSICESKILKWNN